MKSHRAIDGNATPTSTRKQAEAQLARAPPLLDATLSSGELLHELQVHQIELEMQNDALRLAQTALEESRDRYLGLYEFASVGYLTLSDADLITEINLTGAAMFGIEREKLLNRRPDSFVAGADRERWNRLFSGMIARNGKRSFDLSLRTGVSAISDVHLDCQRITGGNAGPRLQITLTDISERKRAERSAERERIRLHTILRMASDGIHILDCDGLLVEANDAFLSMLGYDQSAVGKLRVTDWDVQNSWAKIKGRMDELRARHRNMVFATRHRRRDGKVLEVEINSAWIEIEGQSYLYSASRDNTERMQFERMLKEKNIELTRTKKVAEKANLAKSQFLSSMSHELRSPLNAVLGFAQLLESAKIPPSAMQKESIDQILKAGWYLLGLINEILDLAKIESGKVAVSHTSMSLCEVLQDCQTMIVPQAQQHGIRVEFPWFDTPLYVNGDPTAVKQVIINLLTNAIKYNRVGGSVEVRCTPSAGECIRVCVKDNGPGLSAEQVEKLFQPFNRLGQERGVQEGTGLGLVVSKQLVELMGGHIGVQSSIGIGSEFWFELPAAAAPDPSCDAIIRVSSELNDQNVGPKFCRQLTVLYIEDNPADLDLIQQLLTRSGNVKMLLAVDALEGIQAARTYRPDIILTDIKLPDINGFELLEILREDPATSHIPVLALSANAAPGDIEQGMQAGFLRYLTKPINVAELMDALDPAFHNLSDQRPQPAGKP